MEFNKKSLHAMMALVAFGIVLFVALQNLQLVMQTLGGLLHLLTPFLIGGMVAFIINVPMRAIERTLFTPAVRKKYKVLQKMARPISLICTFLLVIGALVLLFFIISPEIQRSYETIQAAMPAFVQSVNDFINDLIATYPEIQTYAQNLIEEWSQIDWKVQIQQIAEFLQVGNLWGSTVSVATSIIGGVTNTVLGFVFAIYVLLQKEKLASGIKKLLYAWMPEKKADFIVDTSRLTEKTFSKFLSGQCVEACILGLMFFISMTLLQIPYAMVVGVLIALTALIPIFGAFIGCILGAFMILIVNPVQALWFIVLFLVLQQVEGNLIYPRVVGSSVGLPSIWVLVAVTLGASTMGVLGMLLFIPLFSVIYTLVRRFTAQKLDYKRINPFKYR